MRLEVVPERARGVGKNKYTGMAFHDNAANLQVDDAIGHHKNNTQKYVLACAVFASLNSVLLGYDFGVMSGAIIFMKEDLRLTKVQQELLIGCLSILSLVGSLVGGRTSDIIGRKWTIVLGSVVFQARSVVMTFAPSFAVLMTGRFLAGIGIGFGMMIAPVYITEISPTIVRGSLTSFTEIFINLGILLGYVSNYVLSDLLVHIGWRVMLTEGISPSVLIIFALIIAPESPRWLVMRNHIDEVRHVLSKMNENEVEEKLAEIQMAAGITGDGNHKEKPVCKEFLTSSPFLRRMLVAGMGIQCFQHITGIDVAVYYSPEILKSAGVRDNSKLLAATVAVGVSKTAFVLVAIFLVDKLGRKPLLYISTIGMTARLFCLAATLALFKEMQIGIALAILFICANVAFFSVGIGPVVWILTSEIFPLRLRAQAVALGAVGNRVCSGLVAMTFLSVSRAISVSGLFFVFSVIAALSAVFVFALVPETKGMSLKQIELLFKNGNGLQESAVQLGDVEHLVKEEVVSFCSK